MRWILFPVLAAWSTVALGQNSSPANVNDCTLIQDPVGLRNCILQFEGNRTQPPVVVETPPPTPADNAAASASVDSEPGVIRGRTGRPASPSSRAASTPSHSKARDTLTAIEQVELPKRARRLNGE